VGRSETTSTILATLQFFSSHDIPSFDRLLSSILILLGELAPDTGTLSRSNRTKETLVGTSGGQTALVGVKHHEKGNDRLA
jgi:hypothetical protein